MVAAFLFEGFRQFTLYRLVAFPFLDVHVKGFAGDAHEDINFCIGKYNRNFFFKGVVFFGLFARNGFAAFAGAFLFISITGSNG